MIGDLKKYYDQYNSVFMFSSFIKVLIIFSEYSLHAVFVIARNVA